MYADKTCAMCGKTFTPKASNQKYCSTECTYNGRRASRKQWEVKSGYAERKRQEMRNYRAGITEAERIGQVAEQKKAREDLWKRIAEQIKEEEAELKKRAKAGDPLARMEYYHRNTIEYWEAYRDYEYEFAEQFDQVPVGEVNGIPLYDPDFAQKVVAMLEAMPEDRLHIYKKYVEKDTEE